MGTWIEIKIWVEFRFRYRRRKEPIDRTGGNVVPQIFFNEKLIGGLTALNSLRNGGTLESKMEEILRRKCPDDAPAPPVHGFDEESDADADEMEAIARVARQRVSIRDQIVKMKLARNCFSGAELMEGLVRHRNCGTGKFFGMQTNMGHGRDHRLEWYQRKIMWLHENQLYWFLSDHLDEFQFPADL